MTALAAEARKLLSQLDAGPKKRFGQNFMVSETHLRRIAEALTADPAVPVLEIGPGLGFLTRFLLERGYGVTAVEKDRLLAHSLGVRFGSSNVDVIQGDILLTDPKKIGLTGEFAVAGNIPYNITTPILEWMIQRRSDVREAVLTVQKEVAERLLAKPGTKAWGSLTIFLRTFADVSAVCSISRGSFFPPPNVDSSAVHIVFLRKLREDIGDEAVYFRLIRRAFQKRRKMLVNALEGAGPDFLSKNELPKILEPLLIDPRRRPETLTLAEWAALSRRLSPKPGS